VSSEGLAVLAVVSSLETKKMVAAETYLRPALIQTAPHREGWFERHRDIERGR
jgi:hypothetical protein